MFGGLIYHQNSLRELENHPSSNLVANVIARRESHSLYVSSSLDSKKAILTENS